MADQIVVHFAKTNPQISQISQIFRRRVLHLRNRCNLRISKVYHYPPDRSATPSG